MRPADRFVGRSAGEDRVHLREVFVEEGALRHADRDRPPSKDRNLGLGAAYCLRKANWYRNSQVVAVTTEDLCGRTLIVTYGKDIQAILADLREKGAKVTWDITDQGWGSSPTIRFPTA